MNTTQKIVELSDYKKIRKPKSKCIHNSLFDIEAVEMTSIMKFVDKLPGIEITKEDFDDYLLGPVTPSIELIITTIYLGDYLELNLDCISDKNIQNAAVFIRGIYDLKNPIETDNSYIFKIDPNNRSIWIDGYNLIMNLIESKTC